MMMMNAMTMMMVMMMNAMTMMMMMIIIKIMIDLIYDYSES